jgi:ABC-2 type transport system permease protein
MNPTWTVARKELRTLFQSPVALLFLGVFQLVTLFTFFSGSRFFARNIADVRPLFEWLPLLLVFLVSAVTMRQWAEERKLGTLEVLMTLPVNTRQLVLGKFFAATGLVAVALLLTTPLPLMVSTLGDLDWGPVVGGYVGALLLGALYVSLGLCVSARTDNQVVALMLTLVIGGALYLIGTDTVTSLFGNQWAEALRAIGTGARFESIERGVLDLRDLVYYAGLTSTFLVLNWAFLETDRVDPDSARGRTKVVAAWALTALTAANAVLAVVWLTPVTAARIDMTANGDFSVSDVTDNILGELDEPLFIDGYFSERTHPLLAPLVPQIRDLLEEYEIAGRGKVTVTIADPNADEELEVEIGEKYGIRSVPFQVDDRHQQAVVNSFFHIVVRYGDQYEVLSFDSLIEFMADSNGAEVRLRNLEYDLTRTIKRVSQDFQTLSSVLAGLPEPATLTAYVTPSTLPPEFQEILTLVRKVSGEVAAKGGDKLKFEEVDPSGDQALQQQLFEKYGLRPLAVDLFASQTFYMDMVLTMGDKVERLVPRGDVKEADLQQAIEAALQRMTPGQLTTLGVLTEQPEAPPPNPNIPPQFQPPPPRPDYQVLQQVMGEAYEVQPIDGANGEIPATIDVLLVAKPGALSEEQKFAIDQYLMRGGSLVALASTHKIELSRQGIQEAPMDRGLLEMLTTYGVTVSPDFVLDEQNAAFPRPKIVQRGGFQLQTVEMTPYPFFVDVRTDAMPRGHAAISGLNGLTFPWASPLTVAAPEGVEATTLAKTTDRAWTYGGTSLEIPAPSDPRSAYDLAVVLTGTFPSYYAERPSPLFGGAVQAEGADGTGRTIKKSLPDARLAVVGSAEMVSDLLLQLASQPGGEVHRGNLQLLQNLIDWSVEDTELLEIRTAGAFARTLRPLDDAERSFYEGVQYMLALALLLGVAVVPRRLRGQLTPLRFDTVEPS